MPLSRRDLLIRSAQATPALMAARRAAAGGAQPSNAMPTTPATITCLIDGKAIDRDEVLSHEARRLVHVWRKLRAHAPRPPRSELDDMPVRWPMPIGGVAQWRRDLLALKLQIGSDRLRRILAAELALAGATQALLVGASFGRYALSVTDVHCDQGSAEGFVHWFAARVAANDRAAMLVAHPDHHVIETLPNGFQHVLETTGGSPFPTQFDIDYDTAAGNPTPLVAELPVRVGGVALSRGKPIGYAFHQFGDQPDGGFRGRLTVAFPKATPWFMVDGHQWHLACEFSNWIEAYLASRG